MQCGTTDRGGCSPRTVVSFSSALRLTRKEDCSSFVLHIHIGCTLHGSKLQGSQALRLSTLKVAPASVNCAAGKSA